MHNNNGDSEQYIAVLPFCLSLKPNPLQELVVNRKAQFVDFHTICPYFSPNLVAGKCVCHTPPYA